MSCLGCASGAGCDCDSNCSCDSSLDAGCIPVFAWDLPGDGYDVRVQHAFLLGDLALPAAAGGAARVAPPGGAPFVHGATSSELAAPLAALLANGSAMDALQGAVRVWWDAALAALRRRLLEAAVEASGCPQSEAEVAEGCQT